MTEQTQPTDAELMPCPFCGTQPDECDIGQFVVECPSCAIVGPASDNSNAARRAWNTRWGTPAGAGEPYGYVYTTQVAPIVGDERKVERTVFTRNKPPCNALALYTTPQPTQAQAGAMPLTAGWCTHCGEGVTNFCRSKCGDRVCPIGLPRIKGACHER